MLQSLKAAFKKKIYKFKGKDVLSLFGVFVLGFLMSYTFSDEQSLPFSLLALLLMLVVWFPRLKLFGLYNQIKTKIEQMERIFSSSEGEKVLKDPEVQIEFIKEKYPIFIEEIKKPYLTARTYLQDKIDKHTKQLAVLMHRDLLLDDTNRMQIELKLKSIISDAKNALNRINSVVSSFAEHIEQVKKSTLGLENKIEKKKETEEFLKDVESSIGLTVDLINEIDVLTEVLGDHFLSLSFEEATEALETAKISIDAQEMLINLSSTD